MTNTDHGAPGSDLRAGFVRQHHAEPAETRYTPATHYESVAAMLGRAGVSPVRRRADEEVYAVRSERLSRGELDLGAAVTRSMLGWGVLTGPIYLVIGLTLALTRDGFDLRTHALSLLSLGEHGWMQRTNLAVSCALTLIATIAIHRALRPVAGPASVARLTGVFALGLFAGSIFVPDPMRGFPAGAEESVSTHGILHMAFGAVGFISLGAAALLLARWNARHARSAWARLFRLLGVLILAGAALGATSIGVGLIWIAVLASYTWLATACIHLWSIVPHPDLRRRPPNPPTA